MRKVSGVASPCSAPLTVRARSGSPAEVGQESCVGERVGAGYDGGADDLGIAKGKSNSAGSGATPIRRRAWAGAAAVGTATEIPPISSMVTVWYALHGHAPDDVTSHRTRARWYTTKTEPSFDDMIIKLRRVSIAARFRRPCPEQATRKKPGPSSPRGPPPGHDQQNRETRGVTGHRCVSSSYV
jgi:hypothetical protein